MALVRRFEDLTVWQEARKLAGLAHSLTSTAVFRRDRSLADQLRRASVSAMNNVAEGFDSGSHAEFTRFLRYAIRSAAEVQSCGYVAIDRRYVAQSQFDELYQSARRVKSLASALLQRVASQPPRRRTGEGEVREPEEPWGIHTSTPPHLRTSARLSAQ